MVNPIVHNTITGYSPFGYEWVYSGGGSTISWRRLLASNTYSDDFLINIETTGDSLFCV